MDGKEFARLGVLNYNDIPKLFIDKKSAENFIKDYPQSDKNEILSMLSPKLKKIDQS
jgi:hypothetical protein